MMLVVPLIVWSLLIVLSLVGEALALSWGGNNRNDATRYNVVHTSGVDSNLPKLYSIALSELQELESQPLCHRIAARLLVNNCQLLEGQNDATILTDSGRASRDFVDSYAASLAICDLERGSFKIPAACFKFREPTLASLSPESRAHIHVTTSEIDDCLEGLAQSDSAWNTWISYRHKALRFCEAARADNDKDQTIRVHKQITKILERLTTQLEEELDSRFMSLNQHFQDAVIAVGKLRPQVDHLRNEIVGVDTVLRSQISRDVELSAAYINNGIEDARHLKELLATLVNVVRGQTNEIAESHHLSLQVVSQRATKDVELVLATLGTAVAVSASLYEEMENSRHLATQVAQRQEKIERGMQRLESLANTLLIQHHGHQEQLDQANEAAVKLIGIIGSASSSAESLRSSLFHGFGWVSWWPYIFCPVTSLVLGSYGLPPSAMRNFVLISLGELAGLALSLGKRYGHDIYTTFTDFNATHLHVISNFTNKFDEAIFSDHGDLSYGNFQRVTLYKDF